MTSRDLRWCASGLLVAATLLGESSCKHDDDPPNATGKLSIVVTVDWEGAYLNADGLDAMRAFRKALPQVPETHFITPAYFTKPQADPHAVAASLREGLAPGDEVGLHIHAWKSLIAHAGVTPRLAPSFLGPDEPLMQFDDGDQGFEVELSAYRPDEIQAVLRDARKLLADNQITVIPALRIGGTVADVNLLGVARAEGYAIDSSAYCADEAASDPSRGYFIKRVRQLWPNVHRDTQPFEIATASGPVLEMPLHMADYSTSDELRTLLEHAADRLDHRPDRSQVVVLLYHRETAQLFAPRVAEAIQAFQHERPAAPVVFETITQAAARVHAERPATAH